jgi:hypothetical protein
MEAESLDNGSDKDGLATDSAGEECRALMVVVEEGKGDVLERLSGLERQMDSIAAQIWNGGLSVGRCLHEIQREKLYRFSHATFKDYCETGRGISERRAYQLIDFCKLVDSLPESARGLVENECQAKELALCPPDMRAGIIERLRASGELTGAAIAEARRNIHRMNPPLEMPKNWPLESDENPLEKAWNRAPYDWRFRVLAVLIENGSVAEVMKIMQKTKKQGKPNKSALICNELRQN